MGEKNLVKFWIYRGPTLEKFRAVCAQLLQRLQSDGDAKKPDWPTAAFYVSKYSQDSAEGDDRPDENETFSQGSDCRPEAPLKWVRIFLEIHKIDTDDVEKLKDVTMIGKLVLPAPVDGALLGVADDCSLAELNSAQEIMVHIQDIAGERPSGDVYVLPMIEEVNLTGTAHGGDLRMAHRAVPRVEFPDFPKLPELSDEACEESENQANSGETD